MSKLSGGGSAAPAVQSLEETVDENSEAARDMTRKMVWMTAALIFLALVEISLFIANMMT